MTQLGPEAFNSKNEATVKKKKKKSSLLMHKNYKTDR